MTRFLVDERPYLYGMVGRGVGRTAKDLRFGMFDSGHEDTSVRVDEVLAETGFGTT